MAILVSPGVDVQIIDESYYIGAGAGTIPLIILATADNKTAPSGTGIAPYTVPSQAGKLFLATSQRELLQNFGNPKFYSTQGTPIHGYELNEFGLHAAYQYLGISNRCYVVRADIDMGQLEPRVTEPRGEPIAGTYWLDLAETKWGVFQSNGNRIAGAAWETQPVLVATDVNTVLDINDDLVPASSFGNDGAFAVVVASSDNRIFEKINGNWLLINSADWKAARPTSVRGSVSPPSVAAGTSIVINGNTVTFTLASPLSDVVQAINDAAIPNITASISASALLVRNIIGGNITIANGTGTPLATLGVTAGTYKGVEVFRTSDAFYPAGSVVGDVWIKGTTPNNGANWAVKYWNATLGQWVNMTAPLYPYNSSLADGNAAKDAAAFAGLGLPTVGNVYVGYDATEGVQVLRRWSGTRWEDLIYEAEAVAPSTPAPEGTLWYNPNFRCDIMVGNGVHWEGYRRRYPSTDPNGVIIAGSAPVTQSTGAPLVENDLWVDGSDLENYPALYRYDATRLRWRRIDTTDQTTPFGVIFADAREDSGGVFDGIENPGSYVYYSEEINDMLQSDWVDPDAPDPRMRPDGMLLFNTRYSTYNVKRWRPEWFADSGDLSYEDETDYSQVPYTVGAPTRQFLLDADKLGRWVTDSGNRTDGSPYMGRKAQRVMIVRAMQAVVASNQDLRSELVYFNLMAAPGYPEMLDELVLLNTDQKEVAFIVGDTPCRLNPSASSIETWAKNPNAVPNGEDGLSTANIYAAIYYPWGLATNVDGMEIMVPPSTIALHTMAYNDQVAYPWFAPAGFQRGLVTNATTVGYLTTEGEFKSILLNPGQRDTLYENKINPIAFIPGRGLVVFGQKTLSPLVSALDRINVARLANYLKYNLDNAMKPFLFEQNDQQTRDAARLVVERFLQNLVSLRALEDFAVLCDTTNNTPERRDRNELWVDVLIKPLRAIEFIYVPVRVLASGAAFPTSTTTGGTA